MNRWNKGFLIALRIVIGWHFLYEGLWKIGSDTGATAYPTSWYTLQTSVARLRDYYEQAPAAGLRVEPAAARADAWYDEIVKAFKGRNQPLADDQKARLAELRDKVKLAAAASASPDEIVAFDWLYVRDDVLKMPPAPEPERFTALPFLQTAAGPFRPAFRSLVRDIDGIERLTVQSVHTALDARAAAIAAHYSFNPDQRRRLDQSRDSLKAAIAATVADPAFQRRLADYGLMRRRVENAASPTAPFSRERLAEDRKKLDAIAGDLLAFVNEPLAELSVQAQTIATVAQMKAGPLPYPGQPAAWIDFTIEWGLTAIGICLLLGVFPRLAAVAAALQLLMFYLASPPWPGLPAATLGGHYLYIDRNLIELVAACVIATARYAPWPLPFRRRGAKPVATTPVPEPILTASPQ